MAVTVSYLYYYISVSCTHTLKDFLFNLSLHVCQGLFGWPIQIKCEQTYENDLASPSRYLVQCSSLFIFFLRLPWKQKKIKNCNSKMKHRWSKVEGKQPRSTKMNCSLRNKRPWCWVFVSSFLICYHLYLRFSWLSQETRWQKTFIGHWVRVIKVDAWRKYFILSVFLFRKFTFPNVGMSEKELGECSLWC